MSLDPGTLLASLLVSSVGFVLFTYGRKARRLPHAVAGIIMLVYPYFISDVTVMLAVGAGLCVICWLLARLGM
jgi:hypothetical protein